MRTPYAVRVCTQTGKRGKRALPVPTREEVYDVLRVCHEVEAGHSGIHATYKQVHGRYAMIPRRVVGIYCNACRHCRNSVAGGGGGGGGGGGVGVGGHLDNGGGDGHLVGADAMLVRARRA